jgi:hypothetical protein
MNAFQVQNDLVEKLCRLCESRLSHRNTFLLPPAFGWATIPRCHFPAVRGPAIPKEDADGFAGANDWHCRGQRIRSLKKDESRPAFHSFYTSVEIVLGCLFSADDHFSEFLGKISGTREVPRQH